MNVSANFKFLSYICIFLYFNSLCYCCYYNMIHRASLMQEGASPLLDGKAFIFPSYSDRHVAEMAKYVTEVANLPNATTEVKLLSSYSGFLTVDDAYESNIFFWFFPAMNGNKNAPIILWLQGGPGFSSMVGVFAENGPLVYDSITRDLKIREITWAKTFNMIYMDSPVGTGFSHTHYPAGYARNQSQISKQLLTALHRFFTIFKEYRRNHFYIAGEGYACKTIFSLANEIYEDKDGEGIELMGIMVENGVCLRQKFNNYTGLLRAVGLIDGIEFEEMDANLKLVEQYYESKKTEDAFNELSSIFRDQPLRTSMYRRMTGYESLYNYQYPEVPKSLYDYTDYLTNIDVRRALHVSSTPFGDHNEVCYYLDDDLFEPINNNIIKNVLNNYKVLLYHGRKDLLVTYATFMNFLESISVFKKYPKMKHYHWYTKFYGTNNTYAGEVRQIDDILIATLAKAGHFAAFDDPNAAFDLAYHFIYNTPFL